MVDPAVVRGRLVTVFGEGLDVSSGHGAEGQILRIAPTGIERTHGFSVEFVLGWKAVEARFVPGPFAVGVIEAIRTSTTEQRAVFAAMARVAISRGADVRLAIGGAPTDPRAPTAWPTGEWPGFSLNLRKGGLVRDSRSADAETAEALPWVERMLGMVLALLPVETTVEGEVEGVAEGAPYLALVNRYERSRLNRAVCIDHHGARCKVCGFAFGERYGPAGDGFIHVHHLEPLSMMQGSYVLDPVNDLVPLCANCHSMAHRRTPPFNVEELKSMLRSS